MHEADNATDGAGRPAEESQMEEPELTPPCQEKFRWRALHNRCQWMAKRRDSHQPRDIDFAVRSRVKTGRRTMKSSLLKALPLAATIMLVGCTTNTTGYHHTPSAV